MRIDEFSSPLYIDGDFSTTEQSRFLLFGFSITATDYEDLIFNSTVLTTEFSMTRRFKNFISKRMKTTFYTRN